MRRLRGYRRTPIGTPELLQTVFDAARAAGVRNQVSLFDGSMLDDHVPFLAAGMPAVDLIDFQYGARPGGNNCWHTLEDTPDKLSAASLQHVGQIVLRMLAGLGVKTPSPPARPAE